MRPVAHGVRTVMLLRRGAPQRRRRARLVHAWTRAPRAAASGYGGPRGRMLVRACSRAPSPGCPVGSPRRRRRPRRRCARAAVASVRAAICLAYALAAHMKLWTCHNAPPHTASSQTVTRTRFQRRASSALVAETAVRTFSGIGVLGRVPSGSREGRVSSACITFRIVGLLEMEGAVCAPTPPQPGGVSRSDGYC